MNDSLYSLWVCPPKNSDLYTKLKNLVSDLAKRFSSPIFEPHVTLFGDVKLTKEEVISKTKELAETIAPYKVTLDFIDYTDNLYQSLVIRVLPTKEVVDANKKVRDMFESHGGTLYAPHASIIYKTGIDNETKKELIKEIEDQFKGVEFIADRIIISRQTEGGRVEDWEIVEGVNLNG